MIKRMIIMLVLCGLVLGGVFGFKAFGKKMMMQYMSQMSNPVQTVSTVIASKDSWSQTLEVVGTIRAVQGADLAPEVQGTVEHIFIESGQDVAEGTLLLQLKSDDDMALLKSLEAQANLAKITVERNKKQLEVQAISQATFDADKAKLETLRAQVEQQKALLQKKTVIAPFSGRLGIRKVDVGQYVKAGDPVVTLQQLDPVYFDFMVPQQRMGALEAGQSVSLRSDNYPGKVFEGKITAMNAKIEETSRNIEVRATFDNPKKDLRPGMFASATIKIGEPESFITLPQTAVTFNPYGNTVFVIHKDKDKEGNAILVAKTSFVETGLKRGDQIAVLSGIKEGDEIVSAGQLKLRNGSIVEINNKVQPANDPDPKPLDK